MGRESDTPSQRLCLLTLLLLALFCAPQTFAQLKAQSKVAPSKPAVQVDPDGGDEEKDDALGRVRWQAREYGQRSAAFRHKVLSEAIKHNRRVGRGSGPNGAMTPQERASGNNMPVGAGAGPVWLNIGPTGADFEQNGSTTYYQRDSGRLRTILPHPTDGNTVYILSSAGGMWRTRNFEDPLPTWQPLTDYLPTTAGGAAAFGSSPNTIYLGLGDPYDQITVGGAVVKSTDGGDTWSPMIELGNAVSIRDLKVDTSTGTDVVMVGTDIGMFRSADGGATYSQIAGNSGEAFYGMMIWSIVKTSAGWLAAAQPNCPLWSNEECQTQGALFLSTDLGATWTPIPVGGYVKSGRTTLGVGTPGDSVVYAFSAYWTSGDANSDLKQGDLFRSTDGGQTWTALGVNTTKIPTNPNSNNRNMDLMHAQAWYNQMILVDPTDPQRNTVYLGGDLSTAKTTDGGSTWTLISNWISGLPYVHADCHAAAFKSAGTPMVLFGTDGGIFFSTDSGATWSSQKNNGLTTHMFYTITGHPDFPNFAMGGLQDNGTRARSGNTGTFNQINGGDGFGVAMSQSKLQASFVSVYNLAIRRSLTNLPPASYTEIEGSLSNPGDGGFYTPIYAPPPAADPTGKYFFAYGSATGNRIYFTPDAGMTWWILAAAGGLNSGGTSNGLPSNAVFRNNPFTFSVSPTDMNRMAIGANGGRVFVSTDAGDNWTQVLASPALNGGWPGFISNVTWADNNTLWVTSVSQAEGLQAGVRTIRVTKSTDAGANWQDASIGLPDVPVAKVVIDPKDASHNTVYAATHVGVYRTTDGGASWAPYGTGMPNVRVNDLYMPPDGSYLRAATYGRGIWELGQLEYVSASITDDGNSCDHNGALGNNETGHLTVTLKNQGSTDLNGVVATVTSSNPHLTFPSGNTIVFGAATAGAQASGALPVALSGASGIEEADLTISFTDPAMGLDSPTNVVSVQRVNYDEVAHASATETFEEINHGWTINGPGVRMPDVFNWERRELTGVNHTFAITSSNAATDNTLTSPVMHTGTGPVSFSFNNRYSLQVGSYNTGTHVAGWSDGAVIELSSDGGATWTDLGPYLATPYGGGYPVSGIMTWFTGTITSATNPLVGRAAFGGKNMLFPAYETETVNLGTAFADQDIQIRFRVVTNSSSGGQGWEIDDIAFSGLANTPFTTLVPHNEACGTTMTLTSSPNPSKFGETIAFAASISGGVTTTTGTVTLKEGTTDLGNAAVASGQALINVSGLSIGTHTVKAYYDGDAGHAASASADYAQTVNPVSKVDLSTASLTFGDTRVGTSSSTQPVTVTNSGSADMLITNIAATGDFSQTTDCPGSLPVGSTCTITVKFTPTAAGTRTGAVNITNDSLVSPVVVSLTGNGVAPKVQLSASTLSFGSSLVGVAPAAQSITVTNSGTASLTITGISVTGDFTQTNDCGTSLAINAACHISVVFKPTATGARSGKVTITDNGLDTPQNITLSGTGTDYVMSGTTTATVTSGNAATYALTLAGSSGFSGAVSLTCSGAPQNATCTVAPSTVNLTASGTGASAQIFVTVNTLQVLAVRHSSHSIVFAFALLGGFLLVPMAAGRKSKGAQMMILLLVIGIALGGAVACGGGGNSSTTSKAQAKVAPGTYTLTITASNGTVSHTTNLTLNVQ